MSWNNTVRCSHCWQNGHNKAGCTELREKMQKRMDADPDDWRAQEYFRKKQRSRSRTCSYCNHSGHNRKTCKELQHAKNVTREKAAEWRVMALEHLSRIGVGVGALVTYQTWENAPRPAMVTGIDWNSLDHRYIHSGWHETNSFRIGNLDNSNVRAADYIVALPKDETNKVTAENYDPYRPVVIVGPLSAESVKSQVPANWLTGESALTNIFDKDTRPHTVSDWVEFQNFYQEK